MNMIAMKAVADAADRETRLVATIKRGPFGLWHVRATGNGYPSEVALVDSAQSERWLSALVEDGFSIVDPLHFCEMYGVLSEPISQYEDSLDSAEQPGAYVGSVTGDNGRGHADDKLVF